jgi:hypothetical protein
MKIQSKLPEDFLQNLRIRHLTNSNSSDNHEEIINLYKLYSRGRFIHNYSPEHIRYLLENNRLTDGVLVLQYKLRPVSFFGIDHHDNFSVVTRLVILDFLKIPLTSAYLLPILEKISIERGRSGIFFSFNDKNYGIAKRMVEDNVKVDYWKKYSTCKQTDFIIQLAEKAFVGYKLISGTVNFHNTPQYIVYKSFDNVTVPNFN